MNYRRIDNLLNHATTLRTGCDLDLLLFFRRHPYVLLPGDHLTRLLGYDLHQVKDSLDRLIACGLIRKTQHAMHPARMYLLSDGSTDDNGSLDALLELASTPDGRRAVLKALREGAPAGEGAASRSASGEVAADAPAPVRLRQVQ